MILEPGIWEPRFIEASYADSIQYQRFDSKAPTVRMEPWAAWMEQEPPEYWEKETVTLLLTSQSDRQLFQQLVDDYEHKDGESSQGSSHDSSMPSGTGPISTTLGPPSQRFGHS